MSTTEPTRRDLSPIVPAGVEYEPMLLLDTSGSMSFPAAEGSSIERRAVVGEAMGVLVSLLGAKDSQAAAEKAAGEPAGGVMTILFSDRSESIEDLSPENWKEKWRNIEWGGGTRIMLGWNQLMEVYNDEFGQRPPAERPAILALVVTDGEAEDVADFERIMSADFTTPTYVVLAVVGYGPEHDQAYASYEKVTVANDHVRLLSFGSETNPEVIANDLLAVTSN